MADFNVRADEVNVEQIMHQIRARIREKRGVDYTEEQVQELAKIKLEKFLDPKGLRSDLLERFQQSDIPPTYEFDDKTLVRSGNPLVGFVRRMLQPVLKLFFSPNPLVHALHVQVQINRYLLERNAIAYELMHNLVVEMTRTGIEVKNMRMRVESIAGRLDFNERRARALEAVVQYKPEGRGDRIERGDRERGDRDRADRDQRERGDRADRGDRLDRGGPQSVHVSQGGTPQPDPGPSAIDPITNGESLRSRRRRRRRGRRSGPGFGSDERRGTSDERRGTSDELDRRPPSDEHELRATNEELEARPRSDEQQGATGEKLDQRATSAGLEDRSVSSEQDWRAPDEERESERMSDESHRSTDEQGPVPRSAEPPPTTHGEPSAAEPQPAPVDAPPVQAPDTDPDRS